MPEFAAKASSESGDIDERRLQLLGCREGNNIRIKMLGDGTFSKYQLSETRVCHSRPEIRTSLHQPLP